jgi:transposase InsO family protein
MAREEVPMALRRTIVELELDDLNVAEFCRQHCVSTWFFYDLRRRYAREGDAALEPRSRAPKVVANRTPLEVEDAIVAMRKHLEGAGLDAGPASIAFHLRDLPGVPSEATIWRILKARGFIVDEPAKAPKHSHRSFTAARANDCWQLDDTFWALADGTPVKILNVLDDHSRLLVASTATTSCTGAFALAVLAAAAVVLGWPARFLSDNAPAFRNILATALAPLGIGAGHSRPYHPQTNGKVERFHQTLKRFLARQPAAETVDELQLQLDCFRHLYNHERPHRSLERRPPAEVWALAPKSGPAAKPLGVPTTVHHSVVSRLGSIAVGHHHQIGLGVEYSGQRALTVLTGTAAHVFIEGRLVRQLTIDPKRNYQARQSRRVP